jgi:hypothetical protein
MATRNNHSQVKSTSLSVNAVSKLGKSQFFTNRQSVNTNNNRSTNSIKSKPLWNESNQIYEPFPSTLLENPKLKQEHESIFDKLSQTFTSYSHYIINSLLKKDSLYNELIGTQVYTTVIPDKIYTRNDLYFSHESYEAAYTLRVGTIVGNGITFVTDVESVKKTIHDFLVSNKRIYYGFIKLGPKINASISKKLFKVAGHMNSFIIDKKIKRIIHFEPKGAFSMISIWEDIDLVEYLNEIVGDDSLKDYELIKTTTPSFSFKTPQFFDTYCQTYSIYAILLYCLNIGFINESYEPEKFILQLFRKMSKEKSIIFQNYFYCILYQKLGGKFNPEIDFDCGIFDGLVPRNNNSNRVMAAASAADGKKLVPRNNNSNRAMAAAEAADEKKLVPRNKNSNHAMAAADTADENNFEVVNNNNNILSVCNRVGGSKKRDKKRNSIKNPKNKN